MVKSKLSIVGAMLGTVLFVSALSVTAQDAELPPFPKDVIGGAAYEAEGKEVFGRIWKVCHGKSAYPGKAPRLNPSRYTPEYVYDRITNGFRGMPAFKEQFSEKERQAVTALIMSTGFSN